MDDPNENPLILDDDPPIIELLQGSSFSNFLFFSANLFKSLKFLIERSGHRSSMIEHSVKCS